MKIRSGFVSNSSSSSFVITNKTSEIKKLSDFVQENPQLIENIKKQFSWYNDDPEMTQNDLLLSALQNNQDFNSGDTDITFSDDVGILVERVFRYALQDEGESASFKWICTGNS